MADTTSTTSADAVKAPFRLLNAFALRFIDLLNAVNEHIWAEGALDRIALTDRDYQAGVDRADDARLAVYDLLADLTARPVTAATDVPLRRMALIFATLMREGTASAFRRYFKHQAELAACLTVPGDDPIAARIRHMLAAAEMRISRMARLTVYLQDGSVIEAEAEPELVAA